VVPWLWRTVVFFPELWDIFEDSVGEPARNIDGWNLRIHTWKRNIIFQTMLIFEGEMSH